MKEKTNPIRWLVYLSVFCLILGISRMYLDITRSDSSHMIWDIPIGRLLAVNSLSPFQIVFTVAFLYLYAKHSKYAWHVFFVPLALSIPLQFTLRSQGIYFQVPPNPWYDWLLTSIWVLALIYMVGLRKKYTSFLTNMKGRKNM